MVSCFQWKWLNPNVFQLLIIPVVLQALSDSVIGQGMSGGDSALANQLREKEVLLAACLKNREESSATVWEEVNKMTAVLQEYSEIHKVTHTT